MNYFKILSVSVFLFTFVLGYVKSNDNEKCLGYIKYLSTKDKCLSSRRQLKVDQEKTTSSPEYFFTVVALSKCDGTDFACGLTTSWVTEVFQGLKSQYIEYKNDDSQNGEKAGYELYIGDDLRKLFKDKKDSPYGIAYNMRHIGPEDHVWTIEQLPNGNGYRIYQSYAQAYSLKAWLSDKTEGLYTSDNQGDIMVFKKLQDQVDKIIRQLTNDQYNLNNGFENSPDIPDTLKGFGAFVRDYNSTKAINNFEKAWNVYGKGKILSWTEMENYINILADMTTYFKENHNTPNGFSEKKYDDWINLFGSPNPVHYPNLPNNQITDMIFTPKRTYRFEVKSFTFKPTDCDYSFPYIMI